MENAQHPAAAAQQSADAAFSAAWKAARKNGGSFTHATDDAGVHGVIERHAPAEYAEYQRVLSAAQAAMRGTKYEGAIASQIHLAGERPPQDAAASAEQKTSIPASGAGTASAGLPGQVTVMAYANKDDYKKWYMANRERLIAKARASDLANPERAAQRKREYAERNPDRVKDAGRRYSQKPEALAKQRALKAKPEQREKAKRLREHYRDTLHDCFVRRCLAQHLKIKGREIPKTLVDAHRELLRLKRAINEKL